MVVNVYDKYYLGMLTGLDNKTIICSKIPVVEI